MLTADLAMSWRRGDSVTPKYLPPGDAQTIETAARLVEIVRSRGGRPRAEIDRAFDELIGTGTDYKIIRGLVKLLVDRCVFETRSAVDPIELRRAVFLAAAERHPVTATAEARAAVLDRVARERFVDRTSVESSLYADLAANQALTVFDEPTAAELVDEYNLAQAQALLYRAVRMTIRVEPQSTEGYRRLFGAIKAHRLVHTIEGDRDAGYDVTLDGPVSMFHRSQKYGVQMAAFLPALLVCEGWRMRAEIDAKPRGRAYYALDSRQTRLRSRYVLVDDGRAALVEKLLSTAAGAEGWSAEPATEVVDGAGTAFVPDAVARREDGAVVWLEALGFWTPRSLANRVKELERAGLNGYILFVSDEYRASRDPLGSSPDNVVVYRTTPEVRAIRAALETAAATFEAGTA